MKKTLALLLSWILILTGVFSFTVCAENEVDVYQKWDLEFTTITNTGTSELPSGQTIDDNNALRLMTARTGMKPKILWAASGDAYTQKQNAAIASGEIPDMMEVTINQYMQLVKSGQIADLTDIIDKYMCPMLQDYYSYNGRADLKALTIDGRIYGIPQTVALGDGATMFWIRKDWMDKLELDEPKTIADIADIARAFMTRDPDGNGKDDTYGLPIFPSYKGTNGLLGNIFQNVGVAGPGQWILNDDGSVTYGSLVETQKNALSLLNAWYSEGIIPKDFATWTNADFDEALNSGKAGIGLGAWYASWSFVSGSVKVNPDAEWVCYNLPAAENETIRVGCYDPAGSYIVVVRADFEHPEAFMCAVNNTATMGTPEYEALDGGMPANTYSPIHAFQYPGQAHFRAVLTTKVANGEISSQEELDAEYTANNMNPANNYSFDNIKSWLAGKDAKITDTGSWGTYMGFVYGYQVLALDETKIEYIQSAFSGTTDSMQAYGTFLSTLEDEAYTKMIMGDTDGKTLEKYFDEFVEQYNSQGGADIAREVAAMISAR